MLNLTSANNNKARFEESIRLGVSEDLIKEIVKALKNVNGWGSIEIFVQDSSVTQITVRNIKKTKLVLTG